MMEASVLDFILEYNCKSCDSDCKALAMMTLIDHVQCNVYTVLDCSTWHCTFQKRQTERYHSASACDRITSAHYVVEVPFGVTSDINSSALLERL